MTNDKRLIALTAIVLMLAFAALGFNLYQSREALKDSRVALTACYFGAKQ